MTISIKALRFRQVMSLSTKHAQVFVNLLGKWLLKWLGFFRIAINYDRSFYMFFSRVQCKNFKSFKDETISLDKLGIIVGSNAAGKSNTVSIFRFISQIIDCGIENAISLSGGLEYVLNTSIGRKLPLYISFSLDCINEQWVLMLGKQKDEKLLFSGFDYEFEITPYKSRDGFKITQDHIHLRYYVDKAIDGSDKPVIDKNRYYTLDCVRRGSKIVSSHVDHTQIEDATTKKRLDDELDTDFFKRYMNTVGHRKELILKFIHFFGSFPSFV